MRSYLVSKLTAQYPNIQLEKGVRAYYKTLRKAEKTIREIVKQYSDHHNLAPYAFHVAEIPWGNTFEELIISERLYNADGVLTDYTTRSEGTTNDYEKYPKVNNRYPGRTPEQIRFRVGDLVEVLLPRDNKSKLMIIGRVPFSPEKVRELESDAEEPATDIPDEYACFNPLDGKPFHYYAPTRLMAPTLPLEESVKETYRKYMALAAENKIVPRRTW